MLFMIFDEKRYFNMCEVFRNYKELLKSNPTAGKELLAEKGEGEWQDSDIYFHRDIESFAKYELTDGWYIDSINWNQDYRGAPNPMDYVAFKALGQALIDSWDNSCNFKTESEEILSTGYGW